MNRQNRNVAIVGVGLIGRAWAAIFARAGWNVRLTDPHVPTLAAAPRLIRDELHALARHGLAEDADGTVARVSILATTSGPRRPSAQTARPNTLSAAPAVVTAVPAAVLSYRWWKHRADNGIKF